MSTLKHIIQSGKQSLSESFQEAKQRARFAYTGEVSESVYQTLWIPSNQWSLLLDDTMPEWYKTFEDYYFAVFLWTKTLEGRKLVFEEILLKKIFHKSFFQGFSYTVELDNIFKKIENESSYTTREFMDMICRDCYSFSEVSLFIALFSQTLHQSSSIDDHIANVFQMLHSLRNWSPVIDKKKYFQIARTISFLRLLKKEIHVDNIIEYSDIYVFVPNILSSKHGESSSTIDLFSWFIKTQNPQKLSSSQKTFNAFSSVLSDLEYFSWVRQKKKVLEKKTKEVLQKKEIQRFIQFGKEVQATLWAKKLSLILKLARSSEKHNIGDIDLELYIELKKQYFLVQKILENIESQLTVSQGVISDSPQSRTFKFILGRSKIEWIRPLFSQLWPFIAKIWPVLKLVSYIPVMRLKTILFFAVYKIIDSLLWLLRHIPLIKRYKKISEIQNGIPLTPTSELQDFIFTHKDTIQSINTQINHVRDIKKIRRLQVELDKKAREQEPLEEEYSYDQSLELQRALISGELSKMLEEVDQSELQEAISEVKMQYMEILERIEKVSSQSIV